jgi:hypothetical protein
LTLKKKTNLLTVFAIIKTICKTVIRMAE